MKLEEIKLLDITVATHVGNIDMPYRKSVEVHFLVDELYMYQWSDISQEWLYSGFSRDEVVCFAKSISK